ncbi:glycoside hydrolase family 9 protein [Planktotalea sp.]|uniref:glycoside hydrolase family 9 protein n=1 Tax=Planktotalea sp. TaxID=2029877 RepID=UPI0032971917
MYAESHEKPMEIPLSIAELPKDLWSKNRIMPSGGDTVLVMQDTGVGPFNDASMWEVGFNQPLPYGRKQFAFDVAVGEGHRPLWGTSVLQPIVNGEQAVPSLNSDGALSLQMSVSDTDGKAFIPHMSGPVTFQMPKSADTISSFAFMTAGAEGYDVTLSNFRVLVWPEEDNRIWPQRLHVSSLGYAADTAVEVLVAWHDDKETRALTSAILTLNGPDGVKEIPVNMPTRAAPISDSRVSSVNLGMLPAGDYELTVPSTGARTEAVTKSFRVTPDQSMLSKARDEAWGAFYWITEGADGPYPEAHLQDTAAKVFGAPEQTQDVRGGWLDAGDYGKYSVNGAYSVSLMLLTGLIAPEALDHAVTPVANTAAGVPDWLRVADGQLEWLYKMQRADGAVYHKATTRKWPMMSDTPEDDTATKWLMPVTTTATANYAAAMSLAAKIYLAQPDSAYQTRGGEFQAAAERALAWLEENPDLIMIDLTYDGDQYGGPYDDQEDRDERFFAYAAYAALTQNAADFAKAEALLDDVAATMKSDDYSTYWGKVGLLGVWALQTVDAPEVLADASTSALRTASYRWKVTQNRSSWGVSKADDSQLDWGSNSVFATVGWHWLMWAKVSGETDYLSHAERQIHYLFAMNPLDQTYITGAYRNATVAPHFRPWSSGRIELPAGFIAGGPNSVNLAGDPLTGAIVGQPPMLMYVDDVESYATNEVAINWQAAWAVYASLLVEMTQ